MTTLEEIRKYLRGEDVEGLPKRASVWPTENSFVKRMLQSRDKFNRNNRAMIGERGGEYIFLLGKHTGESLEMVFETDIHYIEWLVKQKSLTPQMKRKLKFELSIRKNVIEM